jgi:Protein of unknown function (DUF2975)
MTPLRRDGLPPDLQLSLRRLALFVRVLIVLGAVLLLGAYVWIWLAPGHVHSQVKEAAGIDVSAIAPHTQVAGALWTLVPTGIWLVALHRLWQLFGEYALGNVFSHRALVSLRGFARCALATAFAEPIYGAVLSVIVTFDRKPGTRELNLAFSSNDFIILLIGAVLLAIATVMAEAARVAEDNAGFV